MYFRSNKLNNGDFDYWLIGNLRYMDQWTSDFPHKYYVTLMAVAPSEVPEDERDGALSSLGINDDEWDEVDSGNVEALAVFLAEAGIGATLWQEDGDNKGELLKEMRSQARLIELMFGWYMDKHCNMIGSTGWDFIKNDALVGLRK